MTRRPLRRTAILALLTAVALAASACAGLPASGPVFAGLPPGAAAPPDFSFVPQKPQDGASPEQIVQGFIDAGLGPDGNWSVAQLYLAPSFQGKWKPSENTTIDDRSAREYTAADDGTVTLTVTQRATVDATGAYKPSEGGRSPLKFSLDQVDGEWRISAAPNGIVLGADQFTSVFHQYPLMYFDPAWRYLVPDVRWFPSSNAATRVAQTLIDGKPSPWLSQSVVSAFPDNVSMNVPSVPIQGGVAQVELSGPLLALESATLDRMQTQLQRSLASVGGVTDVSMTYGGTPLEAQGVSTASTRIDTRALVRTDKGFGFIAAQDKIEPIPGITEAMSTINPVAVDLAPDYTVAAVRTRSGVVARVPSHGPIVSLDQRTGLINPTIDPRGYIWSVPRDSPDELLAYDSAGKAIEIAGGAWSNASQVTSMTLSRDGTRLAAILTVGGQPVVEVFGIVRDADGRPKSLGDATPVAKLPAAGIDLAWLDDSTLGVIAGSGASTVEIRQVVGGPGSSMSAPEGVTAISGTTGTTVRLLGRDGTLYAQRGSNWEQAGAGIRVLGDAQGMPAQG
nr:LpqB family beta-propeller domain-containing protein [Microbacterium bovistercoris]